MNEYKIWLAKILTVGVLFLVIVPIGFGMIATLGDNQAAKVSVVELNGIIEDATEVLRALYKESRNDGTKAIVLRVDSPGGAVAPSEEIYSAVRRLKALKPIVVSMGSVAASGGLYASLGASKIYAQLGTQTGSIGVILQIPNYSSISEKIGFSMVTVKSGALKDAGNPFREMTAEERKFLEDTTAKVHESFIHAVVEGRNLSEDQVKKFADGRVLLGKEAKELGLIDEFGDIFDAAIAALKLAGVELKDKELPVFTYANKKKGPLSKFFDATSEIPALLGNGGWSGVPVVKYLMN